MLILLQNILYMNRLLFLLIISLAVQNSWGQDIEGEWNGILKLQGIQLRLVFHIQKNESGYSATMDSPDQKANGTPVTSVSYENTVLKLSIAHASITYEGVLGDDGNKDIAFIVLLAGTGVRGDRILILQQDLIAEASGTGEADRKKTEAIYESMYNLILQSTGTEQLKTDLTAYLKQILKALPDTHKERYDDNFINVSVAGLTSPWMQYFVKYEPATALEKVKCPVLALNGEKDLQVPAKVNPDAIQAALTKGGNKRLTVKIFPGLNHLFQECNTGLPAEYATIEQTFSPVVLDEILT